MSAEFVWPVRVYWEDTDAGGVVYHASYVRFLERARTEWLRAGGVHQSALRERTGLGFVVRSMELDFLKPALLDDELLVTLALRQRRAASILLAQSIRRGDGTELLRAQVLAACVDLARMAPARIPDEALPALDSHDASQRSDPRP